MSPQKQPRDEARCGSHRSGGSAATYPRREKKGTKVPEEQAGNPARLEGQGREGEPKWHGLQLRASCAPLLYIYFKKLSSENCDSNRAFLLRKKVFASAGRSAAEHKPRRRTQIS